MFSILKDMCTDTLGIISSNFARMTYTQVQDFIQGENQDITGNIMKSINNGVLFEDLSIGDILSSGIKNELYNYNKVIAQTYGGPSFKVACYGLNVTTDYLIDAVSENTKSYFSCFF